MAEKILLQNISLVVIPTHAEVARCAKAVAAPYSTLSSQIDLATDITYQQEQITVNIEI